MPRGVFEPYSLMASMLLSQSRGGMISFARLLRSIGRKRCYTHPVVLVRFGSVTIFDVFVPVWQDIRLMVTQCLCL